MDIQTFDKDMHIISALPDEPNDVGGLTAEQMKAKFDEGGLALQEYINKVLLPLLNDWSVTGGSGGHVVLDRSGNVMSQRTRLWFMGSVSDDGVHTVVTFTPEDIGAARAVHQHSAGDISAGVLGISRGGTGANSAAEAREALEVAQAIKAGAAANCYYREVDGEREWLNPPMIAGVEYRTTERFDGKPVYRKLIVYEFSGDIGNSSGSKEVLIPHGTEGLTRAIGCKAVEATWGGMLPYVADGGGITTVTGADETNIWLKFYKDVWTKPTFCFDLAYVKE